jgi:hypothetical protein
LRSLFCVLNFNLTKIFRSAQAMEMPMGASGASLAQGGKHGQAAKHPDQAGRELDERRPEEAYSNYKSVHYIKGASLINRKIWKFIKLATLEMLPGHAGSGQAQSLMI